MPTLLSSSRSALTRCAGLLFVAATLLLPTLLAAEDHDDGGTVTWATFYTVKEGEDDALVARIQQMFGTLLDAEVQAGNATDWWIGRRMSGVFGDGQPDVVFVTNHPSWAGLETTNDRLEALFADPATAAGMRALSAQTRAATQRREEVFYRALTSHVDAAGELPKYLLINTLTARAARLAEAEAFLSAGADQLYGPLFESGKVSGYGVAVRELHNGGDLELVYWLGLRNLADYDGVSAAAAAMRSANSSFDAQVDELFDLSDHRDELWRLVPAPTND